MLEWYINIIVLKFSPFKRCLSMLFDLFMQSVQLDRKSGKKCCMLAARSLSIGWAGVAWEDFEQNRNWTSMPDSRFPLNFSISSIKFKLKSIQPFQLPIHQFLLIDLFKFIAIACILIPIPLFYLPDPFISQVAMNSQFPKIHFLLTFQTKYHNVLRNPELGVWQWKKALNFHLFLLFLSAYSLRLLSLCTSSTPRAFCFDSKIGKIASFHSVTQTFFFSLLESLMKRTSTIGGIQKCLLFFLDPQFRIFASHPKHRMLLPKLNEPCLVK